MSLAQSPSVFARAMSSLGEFVRRKWDGILQFLIFIVTLLRNAPGSLQLFHIVLERAYVIGVKSVPLIIMTSAFTGAVTAWQMAYQFADMIPLTFVGMAVGKSVMIELGPLLTAMVMSGRIGASMCSELGTMAVTEQIDAMRILGLNPYKFLLAPRVIATVFMMPVLTIISMAVAIVGGFLVSWLAKDVTWQMYIFGVRLFYTNFDLVMGLFKAAVFGFIISTFACYYGYYTRHGAEGVGKSTKSTVVASMTSILIVGFLISKFLLL